MNWAQNILVPRIISKYARLTWLWNISFEEEGVLSLGQPLSTLTSAELPGSYWSSVMVHTLWIPMVLLTRPLLATLSVLWAPILSCEILQCLLTYELWGATVSLPWWAVRGGIVCIDLGCREYSVCTVLPCEGQRCLPSCAVWGVNISDLSWTTIGLLCLGRRDNSVCQSRAVEIVLCVHCGQSEMAVSAHPGLWGTTLPPESLPQCSRLSFSAFGEIPYQRCVCPHRN